MSDTSSVQDVYVYDLVSEMCLQDTLQYSLKIYLLQIRMNSTYLGEITTSVHAV